jgi:hypothetical protein
MEKHKSWSNMPLNNKNIDSLSHRRAKFKYYAMMLMHTGNNATPPAKNAAQDIYEYVDHKKNYNFLC